MLRYDEVSGTVGVVPRSRRGYTNGNTVDRQGRLVSCEHGGRRVARTEHDGTHHRAGRPLPGQAASTARTTSWCSPTARSGSPIPSYGIDSDYEGIKAESEIGGCHVYRIDPHAGAVDRGRRRLRAARTASPSRSTSATSTSPIPALAEGSMRSVRRRRRRHARRRRGVHHRCLGPLRRLPPRRGRPDLDERRGQGQLL